MTTNVAVLMGGYSSEKEISLQSGMAVYDALSKLDKYEAFKVVINKDNWVVDYKGNEYPIDKNDFSFNSDNGKVTFDVVFNAVHGTPGEDGLIQAYLELIGVPQTSSRHFESALTFNKAETSSLLNHFGVAIAKSFYLAKGEEINVEEIVNHLGLPVFVKPNRSGSSFGISKVKEESEMMPAIEKAFSEDFQVVIEKAVVGKELACGVARINGEITILGVTEIVSDNEFFDFEAKYQGKSQEITPARISDKLITKIERESFFIYESLNLSGVARVDFILDDESGIPFLIEVNSVPGLGKESIVPKQVAYKGWELGEFFDLLIQETLSNK